MAELVASDVAPGVGVGGSVVLIAEPRVEFVYDDTAHVAASLRQAVKLFWTFRVPWSFAYTPGLVPDWIAQYSFGFYSIMLTSTLIGLIVMALYRPRTWCSFCPMGTMTQLICRLKHR